MPKKPTYYQRSSEPDRYWVRKIAFDKFGPKIVGLADLTKKKRTFEGLAVILDLEGFTAFCDQTDPHHEVPQFLERFVEWLFRQIKQGLLDEEDGDEVILTSHLPIFGKFLGDGVLLLWDVGEVSSEGRKNIVRAFDVIVNDYLRDFLKNNRKDFTRPPSMLRCGIAQGQVSSIADGNDYVGMCINIASRLQKLRADTFSFGFRKKGLERKVGDGWYDHFTLIRIPIRGISQPELVYVFRSDFNALSQDDQRELRPRK
jgi:class 3 adenylate cyclase